MTVDDTEKHKPSEKHALDEVLKSLQDLIRNDLLEEDRPPPPPKPPVDPSVPRKRGRPRKEPPPEPAASEPPARAPKGDLAAVLDSLNELVAHELGPEKSPAASGPEAPGVAMPAPEADEQPVATADDNAVPDTEPQAEGDTVAAEATAGAHADLAAEDDISFVDTDSALADTSPDGFAQEPAAAPTNTIAGHSQQELSFDFEAPTFPNTTPSSELTATGDNLVEWESGSSSTGLSREPETVEFSSEPLSPARDRDSDMLGIPDTALADDSLLETDLSTPLDSSPESDGPAGLGELTAELPPEGDYELAEPTMAEDETAFAEAPADSAGGGLGESIELGGTPGIPEPPTVPIEAVSEPESAPLEPPRGETAAFDFDDIPVLEDAIEHPQEHVVPPATIAHVLESPKLRQLAIRVVARLNIELRRGNERPLKARTVDRLQQILREELETLEANVENKRPK